MKRLTNDVVSILAFCFLIEGFFTKEFLVTGATVSGVGDETRGDGGTAYLLGEGVRLSSLFRRLSLLKKQYLQKVMKF